MLAFFLDFFELSFIVIPLVGPVADKLGIDLIWFGVLLGVNMQTSFMHPPFGFALFYLRSVAPAKDYLDKITGRLTTRVTTGQIYWGAVPFVLIQIVMVALVIALPADGDGLQGQGKGGRPEQDPDRDVARGPVARRLSPASRPNAEQDEATKALEKELGGGAKAPGAKDEAAARRSTSGSDPSAEQDDATKALEKALGGTKAPDEKK